MIVEISKQSKDDVRAIAQDSPNTALKFLDAVESTYRLIGDFPDIGHLPVFDFVEGLKTLIIKGFNNYQVYYRVIDSWVRIERVCDERRDLPNVFKYLQAQENNF